MTSKFASLLGFVAVVTLFSGTSLQAAPEAKDAPGTPAVATAAPAFHEEGGRPTAPDAPRPPHDDGNRGPTDRTPGDPHRTPDRGTATWAPAPQIDQAPADADETAPETSSNDTVPSPAQPTRTGQHYSMDDLANSMQSLDSTDTSHSSMDDLANSMSEL